MSFICQCRLCPRRLALNRKRRSSSTNLVDLEEWAYREQVSKLLDVQCCSACRRSDYHKYSVRGPAVTSCRTWSAAFRAQVQVRTSAQRDVMQCVAQFRRSQVRDRSHRNRCFGIRFGGGQAPALRGIRAVAMGGEGPVEVASDWVDADSADEVRIWQHALVSEVSTVNSVQSTCAIKACRPHCQCITPHKLATFCCPGGAGAGLGQRHEQRASLGLA